MFDCPLFTTHKIEAVETETVFHSDNDIAPVAYLKFKTLSIVEKTPEKIEASSELLRVLTENKKHI